MDLEGIIIDRVRKEGMISFRDYMEMCLYYPEQGFYTCADQKQIGMNGAFYTSANLTPAFGAAIARQLITMWEALGGNEFMVIEYGAGTGLLCRDILSFLKHYHAELYTCISYGIIEKSPVMKDIERMYLTEKVTWYDSLAEVPEFSGCILSNELLDNFAVYPIVMARELMEVYVTYEHGWKEALLPARPEIKNYLDELGICLPTGYRTEVNLDAVEWLTEIALHLKRGYVMTIDYGDVSERLYKPSRSAGTLLCYQNHTVNDAFYSCIGKQDITSHVNFSALIHWGQKYGLKERWLADQYHFLLSMDFNGLVNETFSQEKDILKAAREAALIKHTLLLDMGSRYKVLLQQKIPSLP